METDGDAPRPYDGLTVEMCLCGGCVDCIVGARSFASAIMTINVLFIKRNGIDVVLAVDDIESVSVR